jgi:hypothetical protein
MKYSRALPADWREDQEVDREQQIDSSRELLFV